MEKLGLKGMTKWSGRGIVGDQIRSVLFDDDRRTSLWQAVHKGLEGLCCSLLDLRGRRRHRYIQDIIVIGSSMGCVAKGSGGGKGGCVLGGRRMATINARRNAESRDGPHAREEHAGDEKSSHLRAARMKSRRGKRLRQSERERKKGRKPLDGEWNSADRPASSLPEE